MFELKAGTPQCPFCNVAIPEDLDSGPVDPTVGTPLDPLAPPPVPTPGGDAPPEGEVLLGGGATPDAVPLEGTMDPHAPTIHEDAPAAPGGAGQSTGLKLALVGGAVFLAFKIGLLDNLLDLVGLGSPPPPAAADQPVSPLSPEPQAPAAPRPNFEPPLPDQGGPVVAAPDVPAAPAAPAVSEWAFEGKVSDVLSMKPVKGAVLLFMTQAEDETYEARSDAAGRWQIKLPTRKDGYKLVIDHPEYIAEYFDETEPPYKTWTQARRRQLRAAKPAHQPWKALDASPLRRDVLLFPEFTDR